MNYTKAQPVFRRGDEIFMKEALRYADFAFRRGEVPVGAVIVRGNEIISRGYNRREFGKNALFHAEISAIDKACKKLGGWRLVGCDMYVTLEPCPMCAGAIINSRIENLYFGAYDLKNGCFGSLMNMAEYPFTSKPFVHGGIMEKECSQKLSEFFAILRKKH
ncbi:MAG: nucleoside deaminase [Clostridia bacterium]|nr:nucleoside deaminase [Clostridia bacterium]